MSIKYLLILSGFQFLLSLPLRAQDNTVVTNTPSLYRPIELEGPRLGVSFLSDRLFDYIQKDRDIDIKSVISQFGWQFEKRFFALESGTTALTEWILLVGGVDQGLFIPSVSWIIGLRSGNGFELGVGPNLSISGSSLVYAAGITIQSEEINFPVNFAIAPSEHGTRYTILVGFNVRKR